MNPELTTQLIIVTGLGLVLTALFVGIDAVIDLLLVGIALMIGGAIGLVTDSVDTALVISTILFTSYILFGRKFIKEKIQAFGSDELNVDRIIGQTGTVTYAISPDRAGRVVIADEEWRATSTQKIAKDTLVTIQKVDGVSVQVTPKE